MNRRGFLGWLGVGAATAVAAPVLSYTEHKAVAARPPTIASALERAKTDTSVRFAILMDYSGRPVHTMMVDGAPTEIHIEWADHTRGKTEFRLASVDRYDGRTIPGLVRYIAFKGPVLWSPMKIGL